MAALMASVPLWNPEDDLLLKNAVEAGASLEALAKGAVRFSRKFTVRELKDRWYSLLYDPDISAEASALMLGVELSAPNILTKLNRCGVSKENADASAKRKFDSVKQLYNSTRRKRFCSQTCQCPVISFLDATDSNHCIGFGCGCQENITFEERKQLRAIPECAPSFHAKGISSPHPSMHLWKTMEDVSAPEMPITANVEDGGQVEKEMLVHHDDVDGSRINVSETKANHPVLILHGKHTGDVLDSSIAIPECDLDSLLNFENGEMVSTNEDGKHTIDESCDNVNSVSVSSPNDVQGVVPCSSVDEPRSVVSGKSLEIPGDACPVESENIAEGPLSGDNNEHIHFSSEINATPSSSQNTLSTELYDGVMECTLNSEDPEIPCNDHVSLASVMGRTCKEVCSLSSSSSSQKVGKQYPSLMKKEYNPAQSQTASRMGVLGQVTNPSHQPDSCRVKCTPSVGKFPVPDSTQACKNANVNPSKFRLAQVTPASTTLGLLNAGSLDSCNVSDVTLPAKVGSTIKDFSAPGTEASALIQKEFESDDDVPSFSDIEAMILEMDLCPDEHNSCLDMEVSRYQNENTKRTLIRLEQCAQSSMHRAIASRGALAVLYGHRLKHYIKETKVMLGRATEDMDVDIDLGREGPANKISRRQALIKMEGDGSFVLKNLGKSAIYLNGKEVGTGKSSILNSSSLIEIRGLAFVFEKNVKSVRQYLSKASENHQENNMKFEWSKGVPRADKQKSC